MSVIKVPLILNSDTLHQPGLVYGVGVLLSSGIRVHVVESLALEQLRQ